MPEEAVEIKPWVSVYCMITLKPKEARKAGRVYSGGYTFAKDKYVPPWKVAYALASEVLESYGTYTDCSIEELQENVDKLIDGLNVLAEVMEKHRQNKVEKE